MQKFCHKPQAQYELKELMQSIDSFTVSLSVDDRRIFIARYWFIASTAEIAEKLGFTEGKVKTSLCRTRQKLRKHIEKEGLC